MPVAQQNVYRQRVIERMTVVVNQLRENPQSMSNRDRYAMAVWAMENNALGIISTKVSDRFIQLVCPDYWECFIAGVRGEP